MKQQQERESVLQSEVASLKAMLFEERQRREEAIVGSIEVVPPKPHRAAAYRRRHADSTKEGNAINNTEPQEDTVTIPRSEYESMLAEIDSQEKLIAGFQRENERLAEVVRGREAEERAKKAHFFDNQEALNKELNRLRNMVGETEAAGIGTRARGSGGDAGEGLNGATGATVLTAHARKSAEVLRMELDMDATIRALRERVAIAETSAGVRERELQQTIDQLRRTNKDLSDQVAKVKMEMLADASSEFALLESTKNKLAAEVADLRSRLAW